MIITFETQITSDGIIKLPDELRDLASHRVSVTITDKIDLEANAKKAKIMDYAGIWSDLTHEDAQEMFGRTQLIKDKGIVVDEKEDS